MVNAHPEQLLCVAARQYRPDSNAFEVVRPFQMKSENERTNILIHLIY